MPFAGAKQNAARMLLERGRSILRNATYVWLARRDTLFGTESLPMAEQAIASMIRTEGFPFRPLASLTGIDSQLSAEDPAWLAVCNSSSSSLDGRMQHLRNQATRLLDPLAANTLQQPSLTIQAKAAATVL